jgi:hypothetical protein
LQSLRKYVLGSSKDVISCSCGLLVFISEITARAFIIADSNKRRTLSRSDIAKALSKSDQFDFLIDIVPREDLPFPPHAGSSTAVAKKGSNPSEVKPEQVRQTLENTSS